MIQLFLTLIEEEEDKLRFEDAYYRYRNLMYVKAYEILNDSHRAEDAVQEAFLRIAKNFHKVGEVTSTETKNFFVLITEHVSINMIQREEQYELLSEETLYQLECLISNDVGVSKYESKVIMAILELPSNYRNVLYLQSIYGYSLKEIAKLLGISVDAAKKRSSRAHKALKEKLEENRKGGV